jgi:hypothetical protein
MATRMRMAVMPSTGGIWELAENATMRLPGGRFAVIVRAERGTLLITQEGDPEDHVLESGDEIVLPVGGLAVAWALAEAAISVRHAALMGSNLQPPVRLVG